MSFQIIESEKAKNKKDRASGNSVNCLTLKSATVLLSLNGTNQQMMRFYKLG